MGRFCLYHDTGRDPLPAEPAEIAVARVKAIDKLRAAFELNPARVATVLPLIRLLIENQDIAGAGAVTQAFQGADGDVVTGHMLAVLSHHAAGNIQEAEAAIASWLATQDSTKRRGLEDLTWLLDRRERSRYRALSPEQRAAYQERFWRYADALYLTPGNETRTEHFARHVENHLLRTVPVVRGSTSWGDDVAQLTIRYGIPKARTRLWPGSPASSELQINEHYDPEQMVYAPSAIDSVLKVRARPAGGWPMDTVRSISGHVPPTVRRMLPLEHQAGLFRDDGTLVLRVDGRIIADDSASGKTRVRRALVVLDAELRELARVEDWGPIQGDTPYLRMEIPLPAGASYYS
ncbi:MAG TPA: hypothetical protein VFO52_04185, partial [Longimicrobiales bacterium]|nr:hypothetical protein [Longimicrobiales bacterium]